MQIDRRGFLGGLAACAMPMGAFAQQSLLPLHTPGLDHLDVIVDDVEKTTKFYMGVFNTTLHAQPFRGAFRYFVLLNTLNADRHVGYLAIGASGGRGNYIGHFCTSVYDFRENSKAIFEEMGKAFGKAGYGDFPGSTGFGGIFTDPDGINIQLLPAPDSLVTAAVPSDLVPWNRGLVSPQRVDHVLVRVSDLKRAIGWYSILYGKPQRKGERAIFDFPASQSQLVLEQTRYEYGNEVKIEHFGIRVDPFDSDKVRAGLAALGATVLPDADAKGAVRFRDPDGNVVELCPA